MKPPLLTAIFCAISVLPISASPKAEAWVTPSTKIPNGLTQEANQVAEKHFYECKVTTLGTAINELAKKSVVELTTDKDAIYYAGHSYRSRAGTRPYLVRGAFANYTGRFTLFFNDDALLIQHMALGRNAIPQFCPLIVQLPRPPKKVLIQIGGAL